MTEAPAFVQVLPELQARPVTEALTSFPLAQLFDVSEIEVVGISQERRIHRLPATHWTVADALREAGSSQVLVLGVEGDENVLMGRFFRQGHRSGSWFPRLSDDGGHAIEEALAAANEIADPVPHALALTAISRCITDSDPDRAAQVFLLAVQIHAGIAESGRSSLVWTDISQAATSASITLRQAKRIGESSPRYKVGDVEQALARFARHTWTPQSEGRSRWKGELVGRAQGQDDPLDVAASLSEAVMILLREKHSTRWLSHLTIPDLPHVRSIWDWDAHPAARPGLDLHTIWTFYDLKTGPRICDLDVHGQGDSSDVGIDGVDPEIQAALLKALAPRVAVVWLKSNNSKLDGSRPIDVLINDPARSSEVLAALDAFAAGVF